MNKTRGDIWRRVRAVVARGVAGGVAGWMTACPATCITGGLALTGVGAVVLLGATGSGCVAANQPARQSTREAAAEKRVEELQALSMAMADEYIAALGEAIYLSANGQDAKARALSMSFLRNGTGAAIDIGGGPNPSVAILDLLVLSSLQTWSYQQHWIPMGIGDSGQPALERLRTAEKSQWERAARALSAEQLEIVKQLIEDWKQHNSSRVVVSLVRFEDFADQRKSSRDAMRARAGGLLKEVEAATGAIDEARLLGERALWSAGRYPYLVGQQAELTAYRMAAQPEALEAVKTMEAIRQLSQALEQRLSTLDAELNKQRQLIAQTLTEERTKAIEQAQQAVSKTIDDGIRLAAAEVQQQRQQGLEDFFRLLAKERDGLLDDVESRQQTLQTLMQELQRTMASSGSLADELTKTVGAIDRVVERFDESRSPSDRANATEKTMSLAELRSVISEAKLAAERMTGLLEQTNTLVGSGQMEQRLASVMAPMHELIDRLFWRGLMLVVLAVVGFGVMLVVVRRLTPVRAAA